MDVPTRPAQLDFRILGRVAVTRGRPRPELLLGGRCQQLLLALLLRHPGQAVPLRHLVHEIGGTDASSAGNDLLTASVSALRRLLGPQVLIQRRDGLCLDIPRCRLDSFCFERRFRGAQAAAEMGRLVEALSHVDRALDLWRAPTFGHLALEPALVTEAQRLDRLRLVAQELRAQLLLDLGPRLPDQSALRQRPVPSAR